MNHSLRIGLRYYARHTTSSAVRPFLSNKGEIDGRALAKSIQENLIPRVAELKTKSVSPALAVILVGNRVDSQSYVMMKQKACSEIGITSHVYKYAVSIRESEILNQSKRNSIHVLS